MGINGLELSVIHSDKTASVWVKPKFVWDCLKRFQIRPLSWELVYIRRNLLESMLIQKQKKKTGVSGIRPDRRAKINLAVFETDQGEGSGLYGIHSVNICDRF